MAFLLLFYLRLGGACLGISAIVFVKAGIISESAAIARVGAGSSACHKVYGGTKSLFRYILVYSRPRVPFEFTAQVGFIKEKSVGDYGGRQLLGDVLRYVGYCR